MKRSSLFTISFNNKEKKYRVFLANAMTVHFLTQQEARNFGNMILLRQRDIKNGTKNKTSDVKIRVSSYYARNKPISPVK